MSRRALGHTTRQSPTDFYVHVDDAALRAALTVYEQHLDGTTEPPGPDAGPGADVAVAA